MKKIEMLCLLTILALLGGLLASCSLPGTSNPTTNTIAAVQATPALEQVVTLKLEIQADTSVPPGLEGQTIKISYTIKNTGATAMSGNLSVSGATVTCPALNTVGNKDDALDPKEAITCTSNHVLTKAELDNGSFKVTSVATLGSVSSKPVTLTVPTKVLTITTTSNPATFNQVGQKITYTYVIKNSGAIPIGPTQFVVNDPNIGAPFNCGDANTTLDPAATVTCQATYTITQEDLDIGSVINEATALASGVEPSQAASLELIQEGNVVTNPAPANLAKGSNIQHKVVAGEWLWQIARCYGVDPQKVVQANSQLANPAQISPDTVVNVPNIGSDGTIYGPPCVVKYTVKSGDTWNSIAQQHNADVGILKMVNHGVLSAQVIVPRNSAGK